MERKGEEKWQQFFAGRVQYEHCTPIPGSGSVKMSGLLHSSIMLRSGKLVRLDAACKLLATFGESSALAAHTSCFCGFSTVLVQKVEDSVADVPSETGAPSIQARFQTHLALCHNQYVAAESVQLAMLTCLENPFQDRLQKVNDTCNRVCLRSRFGCPIFHV